MIVGAASAPDAVAWVSGSDEVVAWCGADASEVGELVSPVLAPTSISASAAGAVASALVSGDGAPRCISEIADVVSSAGAADDVPACCEVDFFGIDGVVSAVDSLTGGVTLGLAAISSACAADGPVSSWLNETAEGLGLGIGIAYSACENDGSVSAWRNANPEPAVEGRGRGIGIANAVAGRAVLAGAATCCAGRSSAPMYQHLC